ncbi:MAG: hypothetical protein ABI880_01670, partial [Acidobacteriota bacterium]
ERTLFDFTYAARHGRTTMKHPAAGCLLGLGAWLGAAGAVSWLLQTRGGHPFLATMGVSALAGLFAAAAVGLLYAAFINRRERAALLSGVAGVRPSDGPGAVVVGMLEPMGPILHGPMDGAPCSIYSYEVSETRGSGKRRFIYKHFKGVALTPSTIVTASGSYRLLTLPDLEPATPSNTALERSAAFERYARTTTFIRKDAAAQELVDRWSDADGAYRSDVAYEELDAVDLANCQLEQRHVPPGARVCVFGTFSAAQGGIVPSTGLQSPPRLIVGDITQVAATLAATARTRLVLGVLATAASMGLVAAFMSAG